MMDVESLDIDIKDDFNDKIILNVGGIKYETYRSTLAQYPDTLLGRMFTSSKDMTNNRNQFDFDRDGEIFKYIFDYYRNGFINIPKDVIISNYIAELNFWQIPFAIEISKIAKELGITKDFLQEIGRLNLFQNRIEYIKAIIRSFERNIDLKKKSPELFKDLNLDLMKQEKIQYEKLLEDTKKIEFKNADDINEKKNKIIVQMKDYYRSIHEQINYLLEQEKIMKTMEESLEICKIADIPIPQIWNISPLGYSWDRDLSLKTNFFASNSEKLILLNNYYETLPTFKDLIGVDRDLYVLWNSVVGESNIEIKEIYAHHERGKQCMGDCSIFSHNDPEKRDCDVDTAILRVHFSHEHAWKILGFSNKVNEKVWWEKSINDVYLGFYMKISWKEKDEIIMRDKIIQSKKTDKFSFI